MSLLDQWSDLKKDYPKHIVFIQCGVFFETYQDDAIFVNEICNLKTYTKKDRRTAGFPLSGLEKFKLQIESLGYVLVVVEEMGWSGKEKLRGISYVTGQPNSMRIVQQLKPKLNSETPKRNARKTKLTVDQVRKIKTEHGVDLVLTQIGHMFNAFEEDAQILEAKIGLKIFNRFGYLTAGFPVISQDLYFEKINSAGLSFATYLQTEVTQQGALRNLGGVYKSANGTSDRILVSTYSAQTFVTQKNLRDLALQHARNGFYVLPLIPHSKKPLISDWPRLATTNPLQINAWWNQNPDANIGIACEVSNLIILDFDTAKGSAVPDGWRKFNVSSGEEVFLEVCKRINVIPPVDTYSVSTPSGGKHLYFFDDSRPIKQGTEVNGWWKVDTRSRGGYIVAAGSRIIDENVEGVKEYVALCSISEIKTFPEWLRDELERKKSDVSPNGLSDENRTSLALSGNPKFSSEFAERVLRERCKLIEATEEGKRNHELVRHSCYVGKIVGTGVLNEDFAKNQLLAAALKSGLERDESIAAISRGVSYGIKNSW